MERKVVNDAVAYIRSLAEMRGRNADWAEAAVREGVSLAANDALKQNVIDIVAPTLEDALAQAHGREVVVGQGRVVLDTKGLIQQPIDPDWRTRLLGTLTNPNLALILMMIGIYGLLFEFMNPGALYPGTIGAICLLLGLYALTALPLNYAGLALMALGVALMVAEAFSPSLGILGIGGAIAFVLGGMILIDTEAPGFDVSVGVLAGVAVAGLAFTLLVARAALRSRRRPIVSGTEGMVGGTAKVIDWSGDTGFVWFQGERWSAVSSRPLSPGEQVRVLGRDGLSLRVEPAESRTS
jgi:membrane-bound serine protease (ClpP class)